jgi:triosephosphate isomerase
MAVVRRDVERALGQDAGAAVPVLYGGSVNAANVASYVELESCAGCLVGGASLRVEEFSTMIEAVARVAGSRTG